MNETTDIELFTKLQRLISLFQRINQLSWTSDQTRKRYPFPESMTTEEIILLTRSYVLLGKQIESIYNEWKEIYDERSKE